MHVSTKKTVAVTATLYPRRPAGAEGPPEHAARPDEQTHPNSGHRVKNDRPKRSRSILRNCPPQPTYLIATWRRTGTVTDTPWSVDA